MKVYQKDKLPTNIDVAKDEISTTDDYIILPIDAEEVSTSKSTNLEGTKIETWRKPIIRTTSQDLGEEICDHVFSDAEI